MRFWPSSLRGQTLLAVAIALLVTQAVTAVLLYRADENRRQGDALNRAAIGLLLGSDQPSIQRRGRDGRDGARSGRDRGPFGRPLRPETTAKFAPLPGETADPDLATALEDILVRQGLEPDALIVVTRGAGADPFLQAAARNGARFARWPGWERAQVLIAAMQVADGGPWRIARVPLPQREPARVGAIVLQTSLLFIVLMGVLFLLLRRITNPLKLLTERTERFAATQDSGEPLPVTGPQDVQRLIGAHNAMESRITALLDEKDVMLGAIGHDLKTPLAALRVRIEAVEDDAQRSKMAAGIEDITRSLDDILSLARIGRISDAAERAQLNALAASVVEEFEDMGKNVSFDADKALSAAVHVTWLRRALRNLVSNAVRYGQLARVTLLQDDGAIVLRVEDDGPGIPADQLDAMLEPFRRGEASRNRATGGAGLGLTIARAVAEQHGGRLVLANLPDGGLRAEIRLPIA